MEILSKMAFERHPSSGHFKESGYGGTSAMGV